MESSKDCTLTRSRVGKRILQKHVTLCVNDVVGRIQSAELLPDERDLILQLVVARLSRLRKS